MHEIVIYGEEIKTPDDFYAAFLTAIGAPKWHGHNMDAIWDSITGGDINQTNPPYRVRITGISRMPHDCHELTGRFVALLMSAKTAGIEVEVVGED